jgi:hypothetical protein
VLENAWPGEVVVCGAAVGGVRADGLAEDYRVAPPELGRFPCPVTTPSAGNPAACAFDLLAQTRRGRRLALRAGISGPHIRGAAQVITGGGVDFVLGGSLRSLVGSRPCQRI